MKKLASILLCAVLCLACSVPAFASDIVASGSCGDGVTWVLNDRGTMTISGNGAMNDFYVHYWMEDGQLIGKKLPPPPYADYRDQIKMVVIEGGVTRVGEYSFVNCEKLTSVIFADSVISIGDSAFKNCSQLDRVMLPKYLDGEGSDSGLCFAYSGIQTLIIPGTVTIIPTLSFAKCGKLKTVYIQSGVHKINSGAFEWTPIEELVLPSTLQVISGESFLACYSLKNLYIPRSVTVIEYGALDDPSWFDPETWSFIPYDIYYEGTQAEWDAIQYESMTTDQTFRLHCNSEMPTVYNPYLPSVWAEQEVTKAIIAGLVPDSLRQDYTKPVSRGDVAQMFINLLEEMTGKSVDTILEESRAEIDPDAFTDTSDSAVLAAHALGIINGVGGNRFDPDGTLTRAQIAAIINRVAKVVGIETSGFSHSFTDVTGHWVDAELGWPVAAGIIKGVGNNRFDPNGQLTLEQAIAITYRALMV